MELTARLEEAERERTILAQQRAQLETELDQHR